MRLRPVWLSLSLLSICLATACRHEHRSPSRSKEVVTDAAISWSQADRNLRGRLVAAPAALPPRTAFSIEIELENLGSQAVLVETGNPLAFEPLLRQRNGTIVPATAQRLDILASPVWQRAEPTRTVRFPITASSTDPHFQLDLTVSAWTLSPGRYELSGRWKVALSREAAPHEPAQRWNAELDLPAIALEIL